MKTQEQIVEQIERESTLICFAPEVLMDYLDFEHAKPLLKEGATAGDWLKPVKEYSGYGGATPGDGLVRPFSQDRDAILEHMRRYASFGWQKVNDERGISASRTLDKMRAWLWLLGDDEAAAWTRDDELYAPYGAPILKRICERYGFPVEWNRL